MDGRNRGRGGGRGGNTNGRGGRGFNPGGRGGRPLFGRGRPPRPGRENDNNNERGGRVTTPIDIERRRNAREGVSSPWITISGFDASDNTEQIIQSLVAASETPIVIISFTLNEKTIIAETASTSQALSLTKTYPKPKFNGRTLFIKFADPQTTGRAMADRSREILPSKYDESNKVLSSAGTADIPLNGVTPNYNTEGFVKSLFMAIVAKIPEVETLDSSGNKITTFKAFASSAKFPSDGIKNVSFRDNSISSMDESDHLKPFKFRELLLTGNPITAQPSYVTKVQEKFESLKYLDGNKIATFDFNIESEETSKLPPMKGNLFESETTEQLATGFLKSYSEKFDEERAGSSDAYSDTSLFTITTTMVDDINRKSTRRSVYIPMSRNSMKPNASSQVHIGRLNIVNTSQKLPKTRHIFDDVRIDAFESSKVNMPLLCISIHGHLLEGAGEFKRSYSRTFLLSPNTTSTAWPVTIVNEQLHIRKFMKLPAVTRTTPQAGPEVELTPQQKEMGSTSMTATRSKPEYAKQLLEASGWSLEQAQQTFLAYQAQQKITPDMLQ